MPYITVNYSEVAEFLEHLSDIVKFERAERGLTLRGAADEIGISYVYVRDIEMRSKEPSTGVVLKLLRWLERGR